MLIFTRLYITHLTLVNTLGRLHEVYKGTLHNGITLLRKSHIRQFIVLTLILQHQLMPLIILDDPFQLRNAFPGFGGIINVLLDTVDSQVMEHLSFSQPLENAADLCLLALDLFGLFEHVLGFLFYSIQVLVPRVMLGKH